MKCCVNVQTAQLALLGGQPLLPSQNYIPTLRLSREEKFKELTFYEHYFHVHCFLPELAVKKIKQENNNNMLYSLSFMYLPENFYSIPLNIYSNALRAEGLYASDNNVSHIFITLPFNQYNNIQIATDLLAVFEKINRNYKELL